MRHESRPFISTIGGLQWCHAQNAAPLLKIDSRVKRVTAVAIAGHVTIYRYGEAWQLLRLPVY